MSDITISGRKYGTDHSVYVIAEAGSNHNGDMALALELVDIAASSGADAVKFQLFKAEELYPENCGTVDLPNGSHDMFAVLQDLEMPRAWLPELAAAGAARDIDVIYTPFDIEAVDLLAAQPAPAIKVASPELTHQPLLEHVGKVAIPTVLSTGMSTLGDVEEALGILQRSGAHDIAVLHCVTSYPCPPEHSNLAVIPVMASAFGVPTGLSDHTLDPVAAPAVAVALGGSVIEKHFTISRELDGPDHSYAIEPDELVAMVAAIRQLESTDLAERIEHVHAQLGRSVVETLTGSSIKRVSAAEEELAACDRRSLHAIAPIEIGQTLSQANVAVLRGERNLRPGLHPRYRASVLGAQATREIGLGEGIVWADITSHG